MILTRVKLFLILAALRKIYYILRAMTKVVVAKLYIALFRKRRTKNYEYFRYVLKYIILHTNLPIR